MTRYILFLLPGSTNEDDEGPNSSSKFKLLASDDDDELIEALGESLDQEAGSSSSNPGVMSICGIAQSKVFPLEETSDKQKDAEKVERDDEDDLKVCPGVPNSTTTTTLSAAAAAAQQADRVRRESAGHGSYH